ncbi:MAG TPA: hypothetical protein VF691_13560 [Cytophagaceae bacterium]|jgi:hypothetical protein
MNKFKFFKVFRSPTKQILEMLNNNIIGTPGVGMLYQHLGVDNKIHQIEDPYYINLLRNGSLMANCCLCKRETINTEKTLTSFYIRYFTFKATFRRKFFSRASGNKNSSIRKEITSILEGDGLDTKPEDHFFLYAYVDPRNIRSVALCNEFGFVTVRKMSTMIFNRLHPALDIRCQAIDISEVDKVTKLLYSFYKEYTMFATENLFKGRAYYTIKNEAGDILVGAGVNLDKWKIHSLPGLTGKVILNVLSAVPVLNRIFNKNYEFLAVEGIYFAPGQEKMLEVLLESLLKIHKVNSAMIWADSQSSLYEGLKSIDLGIVQKINKEVQADVICNFRNIDLMDRNLFFNSPAYISAIDLT